MAKLVTSKNAKDVAKSLGLSPAKAVEWKVRHQLTEQILTIVKQNKVTITEVAKKSGTSRARITLILKKQTEGISIDVLIRVIGALGKTVNLSFKKVS